MSKPFVRVGNTFIRLDHIATVTKEEFPSGSTHITFNYHNTPIEEFGLWVRSDAPEYSEALAVYNYIQDNLIMDLSSREGGLDE